MNESAFIDSPIVYIVDDDDGGRDAIASLVQSVGLRSETYANPLDFIDAFNTKRLGVVILDVRLPNLGGLDVLRHIREAGTSIPVVMITGYGDVTTAVSAVKLGAVDYIEKPYNPQTILDLIQKCINAHQLDISKAQAATKFIQLYALLTARELEVVDNLMNGCTNKEIARKLSLSPRTVEKHRVSVMNKLEATSTVQLIRLLERNLEHLK